MLIAGIKEKLLVIVLLASHQVCSDLPDKVICGPLEAVIVGIATSFVVVYFVILCCSRKIHTVFRQHNGMVVGYYK